MSVIRLPHAPQAGQVSPPARELAELLARELCSGNGSDPLVIEEPIGATDRFAARVVWSRWGDVPGPERPAVILAAYRMADAARAGRIAVAEAVLWTERRIETLLPYSIVPAARRGEGASDDEIRGAMAEAGAVAVSGRPLLRFPSEDAALQAMDRLNDRLPNARWILTQVAVPEIRF